MSASQQQTSQDRAEFMPINVSMAAQMRDKHISPLPEFHPHAVEHSRILIEAVIARTRSSWIAEDERYLAPDAVIGVGHGYAALTRDGQAVFEENGQEFEQLMTVAQAEQQAKAEPRRDWQIHLVALLDERHYQRQPDGRWALIRRGYGLS